MKQMQLLMVCSLGIGLFSPGNLPTVQAYQSQKLFPEMKTAMVGWDNLDAVGFSNEELHHKSSLEVPILIAAPENFNPSLEVQPPIVKPQKIPQTQSIDTAPIGQSLILENIQTDFYSEVDNLGKYNLSIQPQLKFRVSDDDYLILKTGFNFFQQPGEESVKNIPWEIGWEGKIGSINLQTAVGANFFDRLPTTINFNAKVTAEVVKPEISASGRLLSAVILSASVDKSPYKFNARTLNNQISAWRFGPDLYWQINSDTSLFSSWRLGNYNDGNWEIQSFTRLERRFGEFSLAANLFTWMYDENAAATSGYFSPQDFLVYNAEVAWNGNIFRFLRCQLSINLGQQRLNGEFDNSYTYQSRCSAKFSPTIEADLSYRITNVPNQDNQSTEFGQNSLAGQLRVKF